MIEVHQDQENSYVEVNQENVKKLQEQQKNTPNWLYIDDKGNQKVNVNKLGRKICNKNNLFYLRDNISEILYAYNSKYGYWEKQPNSYIETIAAKELSYWWKRTTARDLVAYIKSHADRRRAQDTINKVDKTVFNFKNGVFNWDNMKLEDHDPKYYFTSVAGIELTIQDLPTPATDKYFNLIFGENAQTVKEFIGWIFYPSYKEIQSYMITVAQGGEGKSTFINWLTSIVGEDNTAFIPLEALTSKKASRFKLSELNGKFLDAHADIANIPVYDSALLKSLTGNDAQNADVKGKNDVSFKNFAKFFWAGNALPPFEDNSRGMGRRPFIIQFHKIKDFKNAINWDEIKKERGAFIYQCILLARDAINHGSLTETDSILKARNEWLGNNSPIKTFLDDNTIEAKGNELDATELYNVYCNWCEFNGETYVSSRKFYQELKNNFNLVKNFHKPFKKPRWYYIPDIDLNTNLSTVHPKDRIKS